MAVNTMIRIQQASPTVYIILPVHNRRDVTLRFISCLKRQTFNNYQLILIDDGSKDGTSKAVLDQLPDTAIIRGKGNWWWAGSLQQGYDWLIKHKISADDYVLIMNDDTEIQEDFLETGLSIMKDHRHTLLTATGYNLTTGQPQDSGGYKFSWKDLDCYETNEVSEINCLSTRGMFVKVSDFLSIGGFYPRLIPHYLSDLEFTMRAQERGMNLKIHKDFRIYIDFDKSGYRDFSQETYINFVLKLFSKRSAMNPIAWMNFIVLRCPRKQKLQTLVRYVKREFYQLFIARAVPVLKSWTKSILPIGVLKKYLSSSVRSIVRLLPDNVIHFLKKSYHRFSSRS